MRYLLPIFAAALALGQVTPNAASNRKIELAGEAVTDRKEITRLMGIDLGEGVVVVKMRVTPKAGEPMAISIDDFTLVSRKDGEKSGVHEPSMIAGSSRLILQGASSQASVGQSSNVPPLGGPMGVPIGGPNNGGQAPVSGIGNSSTEGGTNEVRAMRDHEVDLRLAPMEAKFFQDAETAEPVEGLLYFLMEKNVKPKDLGLIYAGPAGRLVIDFK